jgi:hypothetical protein
VKQVKIGKKDFLNLLNPVKIPYGGFGDLGGYWRCKKKWFQAKRSRMSSNMKLNWENSSPIKLWKPHGKKC